MRLTPNQTIVIKRKLAGMPARLVGARLRVVQDNTSPPDAGFESDGWHHEVIVREPSGHVRNVGFFDRHVRKGEVEVSSGFRKFGRDPSRDRGSRAKRGPVDRGMALAKQIAKWQPAGRRMNASDKLAWRRTQLESALAREGIPSRRAFDDVLVEAATRETRRADSARFRRAYGWS